MPRQPEQNSPYDTPDTQPPHSILPDPPTVQEALLAEDPDLLLHALTYHGPPTQATLDQALGSAAYQNSPLPLIDLLLTSGARPDFLAISGASNSQNIAIFASFYAHGWRPNLPDPPAHVIPTSHVPAIFAFANNNVGLRWMLDHGASPDSYKLERPSSVHSLPPVGEVYDDEDGVERQREVTLEQVLQWKHKYTESILTAAAIYGNLEGVRMLLDAGAAVDPEALYAAVRDRTRDSLPIMRLLIERGVDVNVVDRKNKEGSPLMAALVEARDDEEEEHQEITLEKVKMLIASGVRLDTVDYCGGVALMYAEETFGRESEIYRVILEAQEKQKVGGVLESG